MSQFQINPKCTACKLHEFASPKSVCLCGRNTEVEKALVVFTDHPDYFADHSQAPYKLDVRNILDWMFQRMDVDPGMVAYEYTLRCYPQKSLPTTKAARAVCIEECAEYRFASIAKLKPKAIVALGQTSLEAFTGKTRIGEYEGRKIHCWEPVVRDYCDNVWIGYSINYILVSPSDTPRVFRVLYRAAEDAGLSPKLNPKIPPFQWRNLK